MMRMKITKIFPGLIFLAGLALLLYPSVSDYWNSFHQTRAIVNYADHIDTMDPAERQALLDEAQAYNQKLYANGQTAALTGEKEAVYNKVLNWDDSGMMGYIEIPSINCYYPIYHGTDEGVLQKAIGHINWTSLPVGGESSHSVLSGHRGLPSARLFTNLIELETGDTFMIVILDETFTYEVDQVKTIEPNEIDDLRIVEGQDYCTLLTCTPYGINTQRLLVRGHRIPNQEKEPVQPSIPATNNYPLIFGLLALGVLAVVAVIIIRKQRNKKMHPPA